MDTDTTVAKPQPQGTTGEPQPRLKLHIPGHHPAPGERPDYSYVPRLPAGEIGRPDVGVPAQQTHHLAYSLIRVLDDKPSLEVRRRIESVLSTNRLVRQPDALRRLRAVRVLEPIGWHLSNSDFRCNNF